MRTFQALQTFSWAGSMLRPPMPVLAPEAGDGGSVESRVAASGGKPGGGER